MKWYMWIIVVILIVAISWFVAPWETLITNKHEALINEIDSATNWNTLKEVEDSCRAMISNYKADALTYNQYKDSTEKEQKNWAEQARMRANRTATQYNEYILKNNYVWKNGIPADIDEQLPYI